MIRLRLHHVVILQVVVLTVLTFYQLGRIPECSNLDQKRPLVGGVHPKSEWKVAGTTDKTFSGPYNNTFGGCLIIQDDNHLLAEWLAYHYHVLPMRRLIVAIDPRSLTSPSAILDRYRKLGLMKITEWQEEDFMPPEQLSQHERIPQDDVDELNKLYLERQIYFYARCMAILRNEGVGWTAIIDTDEYVLPNPRAAVPVLLNTTEGQTIHDLIVANRRKVPMIKYGCISMHRVLFGFKESDTSVVQKMVPTGYNATDFSTLRWRYRAKLTDKDSNRLSKCLVNLERAVDVDFRATMISAHRPLKRLCREDGMRIQNRDSPIVAYHYTGSWEQWNYRNDFRAKRQRETFEKFNFDKYHDDQIRPWLQQFVNQHGEKRSAYLLEGAGKLEPKPKDLKGQVDWSNYDANASANMVYTSTGRKDRKTARTASNA